MPQIIEIFTTPETAFEAPLLRQHIAEHLQIPTEQLTAYHILRRSIDARQRSLRYWLRIAVAVNETPPTPQAITKTYQYVAQCRPILIIGAGPAGLFAALKLLELGYKPIILERGKNVRDRRRDLAAINKQHILNPESNYCFGEGGAGTYSDGKLYTRSNKRGSVEQILQTLVYHGAPPDILVDTHPHIGTNKLPHIIENIRQTIIEHGGEVHFNTKVSDFVVQHQQIKGVVTADGQHWEAAQVILATGHSARDIHRLLHEKGIDIIAKSFAMGIRIEHPQTLIDQMQYKTAVRNPYLPPAAYSWVEQVRGRGVYSFCMCPGGIIAPCATAKGEIVTNGWSPSRRNNPFANSGIVVAINAKDWQKFDHLGELAGTQYQSEVEQAAWRAAGKTQQAPAQRLMDFLNNKTSTSLPDCSYLPGIVSVNLQQEVLPAAIYHCLKDGFKQYGKKMPAYLTNEAVVVGVETRTSSPIRIPRDPTTYQHPQIGGLYPIGEGAGYAGGIVSAAIDGVQCAERIAQQI